MNLASGRPVKRLDRKNRKKSQTTKLVAISVFVTVILVFSVYALIEAAPKPRLVIDWRLKITFTDYRSGRAVNSTPPAFIGVEGGTWLNHTFDSHGLPGYAPVSTRSDNGTIYIQSTLSYYYTFGYFFDLWGKPFDRNCAGDFCGGGGYANPVMSDGSDERCIDRNLNLSNGKDWVILIGLVSPIIPGNCQVA